MKRSENRKEKLLREASNAQKVLIKEISRDRERTENVEKWIQNRGGETSYGERSTFNVVSRETFKGKGKWNLKLHLKRTEDSKKCVQPFQSRTPWKASNWKY